MSRILITGGSGFIGSHLVQRLLPQHEVVVVGRKPPAHAAADGVEWVACDLSQSFGHHDLPANVDAIIHLAQSEAYREFPHRAREIFEVNVGGTMRLLDFAQATGVGKFIFAGSGGIYQYADAPIAEGDPIRPLSFYLASKAAAETLMRTYESLFPVIVLRLFFVYGPGQQPGMLVPGLARKVLGGERIRVEGSPGIRINPIHVTDAVHAFASALNVAGSWQINVAGDETVSISALATMLGEAAGQDVHLEHMPSRTSGDLVADTTRMRELLGVPRRVQLQDGLQGVVRDLDGSSGALHVTAVGV